MRIVVGSGRNGVSRHTFDIPRRKSDPVGWDKMKEDLLVYLGLRPRVSAR